MNALDIERYIYRYYGCWLTLHHNGAQDGTRWVMVVLLDWRQNTLTGLLELVIVALCFKSSVIIELVWGNI